MKACFLPLHPLFLNRRNGMEWNGRIRRSLRESRTFLRCEGVGDYIYFNFN